MTVDTNPRVGSSLTRRERALQQVRRSPSTTKQLAALLGTTPKKMAELLQGLHAARLVQRTAVLHGGGRPAFLYYCGARPHPRTYQHTMAIVDVHAAIMAWLATTPYTAEFFYTNEVTLRTGIIPDATLLLRHAGKVLLYFIEVDLGTEPVTGAAAHTLASKCGAYANYIDAQEYHADFSWAGTLRGFRVALIVPSGRVKPVQHLLAREHWDFIIATSLAQAVNDGIGGPIWSSHDARRVDLLGRPAPEQVGEKARD